MTFSWIFDLGNTLSEVPKEYDRELRLQHLLGYRSTNDVRNLIYKVCGKYPGQTIPEFIERFNQVVNPNNNRTMTQQIEEVWYEYAHNAVIKPGAIEVLDIIRQHGGRTALISNATPLISIILDRLNLRPHFDCILLSCDIGYLKPDPRIFQAALDKLNASPREAIVVGDKIRTDIVGGAILGSRSILIEERLHSVIENGQNYVDAIIPHIGALTQTKIFAKIVY